MGVTKVHFDNTRLVHFLCRKCILKFCVGDAEITERLFTAAQVSNDAEDVDTKFNKAIVPDRCTIINLLPDKDKVNVFILLIVRILVSRTFSFP